ncbi:MAG: restriction endonuclease subunit S [Bacteroidia bacterium]|nr:restriction endonuclease subunit S [Bacteroidia bacterium]
MAEQENNLPKGWQSKTLGEVFTIERGGSPRPIEDFITSDSKGINWIKIGDTKNATKYIYETAEKIKPEGAKRSRMVYEGDFLLSNSMSFGRPYIMKTSGCIHDGWLVIRNNENIDNDYLYHILSSNYLYQQFSNLAKGSTVKNLNIEAVKKAVIRFPSIEKQRAIVLKVEELLSELESTKNTLLLVQDQLKVFRSSTLKFAFEGRFTNNNVPSNGLPKDWKQVKLGELANAVDPQPSHRTPPIDPEGIPYASIKDFDSELDKIDLTSARKVSPSVLKEHISRYTLQKGDFVIGKIGTIGKPVRIVLPQNYCLSANIVLIQPRKIDPTFLFYFFQSNIIEKAFSSGANSTTQAAFGIQKVRELVINLPSPEEQKKIVIEIENRISVAEKIGEDVKTSLKQLETLKQSVLKKAFEGKLVNEN